MKFELHGEGKMLRKSAQISEVIKWSTHTIRSQTVLDSRGKNWLKLSHSERKPVPRNRINKTYIAQDDDDILQMYDFDDNQHKNVTTSVGNKMYKACVIDII